MVRFCSALQDDEDGHMVVLIIIEELMSKTQDEFLDNFARLGVFSKVQALIGGSSDTETDVIRSAETPAKGAWHSVSTACILIDNNIPTISISIDDQLVDAKEILQGKAYHWREWSVCRGRDCLYVWSDSAALELSNGSNGWFRFILDGKLATMYSSGSPENGSDSSGEFRKALTIIH